MEEMRRVKAVHLIAGLVLFALVGAACSSKTPATAAFKGVPLTGSGATFPQPVYEALFKTFHDSIESGAQITYGAGGSGKGISDIQSKVVDFGASDPPLSASDQRPGLLEIPTVLGAVTLAYNVPGVPTGLKLTPDAIAGIFSAKIKFWDDAAIKGPNAGATLPHQAITPVVRQDSSGTTSVFASYLNKVNPAWKADPNLGGKKDPTTGKKSIKQLNWPKGFDQEQGNANVASGVQRTKYSIGYVELAYALSNNISFASVPACTPTATGCTPGADFVTPSVQSVSAAGAGLTFPITPDTNVLNSSASGAYPISTTTYLLVYQDQTDKNKGQTLVDLIYWLLHKGQDVIKSQNYAPLPDAIVSQDDAILAKITSGGTALTPSAGVK
jgi:phosphate transport system substrate-binding protein